MSVVMGNEKYNFIMNKIETLQSEKDKYWRDCLKLAAQLEKQKAINAELIDALETARCDVKSDQFTREVIIKTLTKVKQMEKENE